jgi:hypothetical protein
MLRTPHGYKRALLKLVCALLLFAQHVGLSHAIWHASRDLPAQQQRVGEQRSDAPASREVSRICALDVAFAQVLGGGPLACHSFSVEKPAGHLTSQESYAFVSSEKPSPRSRGPPALS